MKNGKKPTLRQKREMRSHGMGPADWLVVKDTPELLEVVNRASLKFKRPKVRRLTKEI